VPNWWYVEMAKVVLSWPVAAFGIVVILRRDLGRLLQRLSERIREVKAGDTMVTFDLSRDLEEQKAANQKIAKGVRRAPTAGPE
jgi:hypothetical protein